LPIEHGRCQTRIGRIALGDHAVRDQIGSAYAKCCGPVKTDTLG
jgi:tetrahydromethanopterin S-methyltransferase subunit A